MEHRQLAIRKQVNVELNWKAARSRPFEGEQ